MKMPRAERWNVLSEEQQSDQCAQMDCDMVAVTDETGNVLFGMFTDYSEVISLLEILLRI